MRCGRPRGGETVRVAAREAARLGLELGVSVGGFGCERQADLPEYAEQSLFSSSRKIKGPAKVDETLSLPAIMPLKQDRTPQFYRDIAVLAVPGPRRCAAGSGRRSERSDGCSRPPGLGRAGGRLAGSAICHSISPGERVIDHLSAEALDKKWDIAMGKVSRR